MSWLDDITREKRDRKEADDAINALAIDRRDQYRSKVKEFWAELCDRLLSALEHYNDNVPTECGVVCESLLGGTRLIINAGSPPPRSLTVQFNFEAQRISCYQMMPEKSERHFRLSVGRDGTLSMAEDPVHQAVPSGNEEETILKSFLRAL